MFQLLHTGTVFAADLIVLKMVLNGEDKGEFFMVLSDDNDIWIKKDDLGRTELLEGLGSDTFFDGEIYVPLSSISGLLFRIYQDEAALDITAPPHLFKKQYVDASVDRSHELGSADATSGFLNYYGGYSRFDEFEIFNFSGEMGIGTGNYLARSTFSYSRSEETVKAARLISDLTITDSKNLRTITAGDVTASSGPFGSCKLLGGLKISRNYALSPYLIKYPSLNLSGTAESPSEVEVYLNDTLARRETLSPGEFEFNDLPPTGGAGTARIVIRDIYGRERAVSTPYYISDRLLKKGLHEYSYSLGFIRENFGTKNFDYGRAAFLGYHDFGLSDNFRAGLSSEASKALINIGLRGSALVPKGGVVSAAVSCSRNMGTSGANWSAGYAYVSRNFNLNVSLQSASRGYSSVSMKPSDDKAKLMVSNSVGFGWDRAGFITAAYTYFDTYAAGTTSITAVSYNKALSNDTSFFLNAIQVRDVETKQEITLGLRVYLGQRTSGAVSYSGGKGSDIKRAEIQKSPPTGTGFGYRAGVENTRSRNNAEGHLSYQNRYGMYKAELSDRPGGSGYRISYAGGMGFIGESVFFGRPVTDSFAKVKVGDIEGVRVYSYNNEIGKTDSHGEVIIPDLQSFNENRIDIEPDDVPITYSIRSLTRHITPAFRSGSVVEFDVDKMRAVSGTVYIMDEKGVEAPVQYTIMRIETEGKIIEGMVGSDGGFYIEDLPPGGYRAKITFKEKTCIADISVPESEDTVKDLGKVACEAVQ
ncbi:MAG: fimbria/pilus outer membrane usher protein [Nitrospirota bacterium]